MAVSKGYPLGYNKGFEITGLEKDYGKNSIVFQAGTKEEDGQVITNGGRVICVTSLHKDLGEAVRNSLEILNQIDYDGIYYRRDIGYEFISNKNN
jgi:phosphoribosylamine--glycine ligase